MFIATDALERKSHFQIHSLPLHVDGVLAETAHLSTVEAGAHFRLTLYAAKHGGALPDDDKKLSKIVGLAINKWRKIRDAVLDLWEIVMGQIRNQRVAKEIAFKAEKSDAARANANARWANPTKLASKRESAFSQVDASFSDKSLKNNDSIDADAMQTLCSTSTSNKKESPYTPKGDSPPPEATAEPPLSSGPEIEAVESELESEGGGAAAPAGGYPEEFELLWRTLPARRDGKGAVKKAAFKRWKGLNRKQKDRAQAGAVLLAKKYEGKSTEYAPGKTNWIRNDAWEDLLEAASGQVEADYEDCAIGEMGSYIRRNEKGEACLIF